MILVLRHDFGWTGSWIKPFCYVLCLTLVETESTTYWIFCYFFLVKKVFLQWLLLQNLVQREGQFLQLEHLIKCPNQTCWAHISFWFCGNSDLRSVFQLAFIAEVACSICWLLEVLLGSLVIYFSEFSFTLDLRYRGLCEVL